MKLVNIQTNSAGMKSKLGFKLLPEMNSEAVENLELRKPRTLSPRKFIKRRSKVKEIEGKTETLKSEMEEMIKDV